MAKTVTQIKIFLASPSDTVDERRLAEKVVDELNQISPLENVELKLVKWENDSYPGVGADPQDVINKELKDDYDIFVGLMWKRFGTPTKRAGSGTEEEFLRAIDIYSNKSKPIKILFYFNQTPIPPKEINIQEFTKVNDFKSKLQSFGVFAGEYSDSDEFSSILKIHLTKVARELLRELHLPLSTATDESADEAIEEPGLFNLLDSATEDFGEITEILGRMTEFMTELGEKINRRAEEINRTDMRTLKPQELVRLVDRSSSDMQNFVRRMNAELTPFKELMSDGFDSLTKAYTIYYTDWGQNSKEETESFEKIEELLESMLSFKESMDSLRKQVLVMPRATTSFNKSKRDVERVIKTLVTEVSSAINQINEVKKLKGEL